MPLPESVRRIAECAPGKSVRVVAPDGTYKLLAKDDAAPPDPTAETAARLAELDAQIRATVGTVASLAASIYELAKNAADAIALVKTAAANAVAMQASIDTGLEKVAAVLAMPTEPVYRKDGKLIGAKRVKKLGD